MSPIQGKFRYDYDDKSIFLDILTRTCLAFTYKNEPIEIVFEEREDFQESNVKAWLEHFYEIVERILVQQPDIPAYFPEIATKISDKKNAGIQVTDFILWSLNRTKKKNTDTTWYDRLKFTSHSNFHIDNKLYSGGECLLRQGWDEKLAYFRYPISCLTLKELPSNFIELLDLYLLIEYQLLKLNCTAIPTHVLHLK